MKMSVAVLALCTLTCSAHAVEIDACFVVNGLDEKPILDGAEGEKDRPVLTLGRSAARALVSSYQDDTTIAPEKKRLRGDLGMRLYHAARIGEKTKALCKIDLSAEDLTLTKEYVAKFWSPLVISQLWPVLDGKKTEK